MHQGSDLIWKILLQSERFQAMDQCLQETSGRGELGKLSLGEMKPLTSAIINIQNVLLV